MWLSLAEPRLLALIEAWARCGSTRSCAAHSLLQYPGTDTGAWSAISITLIEKQLDSLSREAQVVPV